MDLFTISPPFGRLKYYIKKLLINPYFFGIIDLPRSMDKIHGIRELVAPSSPFFYKNSVKFDLTYV